MKKERRKRYDDIHGIALSTLLILQLNFFLSSLSLSFQLNLFRTAVPFWGQTSQISSSLPPKRDCGSKGIKLNPFCSLRVVPCGMGGLLRVCCNMRHGHTVSLLIFLCRHESAAGSPERVFVFVVVLSGRAFFVLGQSRFLSRREGASSSIAFFVLWSGG